jgi:indolepyruvate ferredoxin oxidoreductase alpha subunit
LIERLDRAKRWIAAHGLNQLQLASEPGGIGLVAVAGVSAYLEETLKDSAVDPGTVSTLHVVTSVPFPEDEGRRLLEHCEAVLVLEELAPYVERELIVLARQIGWNGRIVGKLDSTLPRIGEVTAADVVKGLAAVGALGSKQKDPIRTEAEHLAAPRPITVCAGCPHRGTYLAIEAAIKSAGLSKDDVMVTGDIGCTILGMNPPFDLLWTEVSMGSSISLAQGYVRAGIATPVIATIGDSTFFHGGIPGLINAIQHNTPLTLVIMDNGWTSMTGMQVNPGTNAEFQPAGGRRIDLVKVVEGLGPDSLTVVDPYDVAAATEIITASLSDPGVHVVIAQRECAIQARRRGNVAGETTVDPEACILCKKCLRVTGCPALSVGEESIVVDPALCNGCGICSSVCPTNALTTKAVAQ